MRYLILIINEFVDKVTYWFKLNFVLNRYTPQAFVDAIISNHFVTSHLVANSRLPETITLVRPNAAVMYLKIPDLKDFKTSQIYLIIYILSCDIVGLFKFVATLI